MYYKHQMSTVASLLALAFVLIGCGRRLTVTYASWPEGARLYENGVYKGQCPLTLYYSLTKEQRKEGIVKIAPMTFQWIDGKETTTDGTINFGQLGYRVNYNGREHSPTGLAIGYGEAYTEYHKAKNKFEEEKKKEAHYRSTSALFLLPAVNLQAARSRALGSVLTRSGAAHSASDAEIAREKMETARSRLLSYDHHWKKIE